MVTRARDTDIQSWFLKWRRTLIRDLCRHRSLSRADAEDVGQEVFLRLMFYGDTKAVRHPIAYLLRAAANVISERRERVRERLPHQSEWLDHLKLDTRDEPENRAAEDDERAKVHAAINTLSPRQQVMLAMQMVDHLTYREIAERLELSGRVVLRELVRARAQLRVLLADTEVAMARRLPESGVLDGAF